MLVPGQDERDWEFAEKFNLPIVRTVQPPKDFDGKAYLGDGPAINSDFLNGLNVDDAVKKINNWLEEKGIGKATINDIVAELQKSTHPYVKFKMGLSLPAIPSIPQTLVAKVLEENGCFCHQEGDRIFLSPPE